MEAGSRLLSDSQNRRHYIQPVLSLSTSATHAKFLKTGNLRNPPPIHGQPGRVTGIPAVAMYEQTR
jgi:hypothetical protein